MNYYDMILTALSLGLRLSDLESIPERTEVELHKRNTENLWFQEAKKIKLSDLDLYHQELKFNHIKRNTEDLWSQEAKKLSS